MACTNQHPKSRNIWKNFTWIATTHPLLKHVAFSKKTPFLVSTMYKLKFPIILHLNSPVLHPSSISPLPGIIRPGQPSVVWGSSSLDAVALQVLEGLQTHQWRHPGVNFNTQFTFFCHKNRMKISPSFVCQKKSGYMGYLICMNWYLDLAHQP